VKSSSLIRDHSDADCRCLCGSLLARVVAGGVELRCRRCKRTVVVPLEPDTSTRAAAAARVRRAG
jgi:phage FluMu protein Com